MQKLLLPRQKKQVLYLQEQAQLIHMEKIRKIPISESLLLSQHRKKWQKQQKIFALCVKLASVEKLLKRLGGLKMERYKEEFIEFMVESDCLVIWRIYAEKWKKITIFHERGSICDRLTA